MGLLFCKNRPYKKMSTFLQKLLRKYQSIGRFEWISKKFGSGSENLFFCFWCKVQSTQLFCPWKYITFSKYILNMFFLLTEQLKYMKIDNCKFWADFHFINFWMANYISFQKWPNIVYFQPLKSSSIKQCGYETEWHIP